MVIIQRYKRTRRAGSAICRCLTSYRGVPFLVFFLLWVIGSTVLSSTQQPLDLESVSGRGGYDSTSEPLLTDETVEAKKVLLTNATKVTEAATEQKTITMVDQNSTNFESRSKNDLRYKCMLKTKPLLSLSLARIILFQSNGAHQLKNFMAYYSRVLPMDSIVIIDHQSTDDGTSSLLKKYAGLGAHVWRCEGKFDYKDQMWSGVINRYAKQSEFVFPLDIDEYIAVLKPGPDPERDRGEQVLHWNHGDFSNALHELEDSGKPFKMEKGNAYPVDCNNRDREWLGIENGLGLWQRKQRTKGCRHHCNMK